MVKTAFKSMHNWRCYPSSNCDKIDQKHGSKFGALLWHHLPPEKNRNIGAQLQFLLYTSAKKIFRKIYFLYDFQCAQTCSFWAIFGLQMWNL